MNVGSGTVAHAGVGDRAQRDHGTDERKCACHHSHPSALLPLDRSSTLGWRNPHTPRSTDTLTTTGGHMCRCGAAYLAAGYAHCME